MSLDDTEIFLDDFSFTEGVRWHQNNLWFCDVWDNKVYSFDIDGVKTKELFVDGKPVGLGWLSDGSLLITSLMKRELLRFYHDQLSIYKTLEIASPGYCHDFTVAHDDVIYLSASGFLPSYNAKPVKSNILMITPNKDLKIAAKDIGYPNGIVITPDGKNLIVAESFSATILSFEIDKDGALVNKEIWAKFDDLGFKVDFDENGIPMDMNRHYPDGICFDKDLDAVWVASPGRKEVVCVDQHNKILRIVKTISHPFDCILGGKDSRILFIASSDMLEQKRTGKIEYIYV
jgi:sugar lactone lactonase YvrE